MAYPSDQPRREPDKESDMGEFLDDVSTKETPEEIKARERVRMVTWMRSVLAEKNTPAERKAFMNKVQASAAYHGITLEELEQGLPDARPASNA